MTARLSIKEARRLGLAGAQGKPKRGKATPKVRPAPWNGQERHVCTLTVPVDIGAMCPNVRLNRWALAAHRSDARAAAWYVWIRAGQPFSKQAVNVYLTIRRGRKLDGDNALAACKSLLDGLFTNDAITPADSSEWVTVWPVEQETGKKWVGREEVIVRVERR